MLRVFGIIVCGSLAGLFAGWSFHQSRYGKVSEFGPFSMENEVTPASVASFMKSKVQEGSPRIEVVDGEEFDFGVMEPDSKGEHQFVVRNTGEFPLSLEIVGSTCKCTIGKLEKSSIGPGEQTEIKLTWDVKSTGEDFGQSAILKTNDPTRGELQLKVKGRVISQMTMVPRTFSFGEVESGDTIELDAVVYNFQNEPIVPTSQKFTDDSMTTLASFEVTEIDVKSTEDQAYANAKQAFRVVAKIRPGLPQGSVQQNFSFGFVTAAAKKDDGTFDPKDEKFFQTSIAGRIVGTITLVESSKCQRLEGGGYVYTIGRVNPATAKPERANIMLRGNDKDSVKLSLGAIEPANLLMAELGEPVGRGSVLLYPLRLWVNPEAKSGERLGKSDDDYGVVPIQTDKPEVSPLKLKVRFAVAK